MKRNIVIVFLRVPNFEVQPRLRGHRPSSIRQFEIFVSHPVISKLEKHVYFKRDEHDKRLMQSIQISLKLDSLINKK